jgi:hypothetical protein
LTLENSQEILLSEKGCVVSVLEERRYVGEDEPPVHEARFGDCLGPRMVITGYWAAISMTIGSIARIM